MHKDLLTELFPGHDPASVTVSPITGEASARSYFRLLFSSGSYILCLDPSFTEANETSHPFILLHSILAPAGVRVPALLRTSGKHHALLQEDCGTTMLQEVAQEAPGYTEQLYRKVIDVLASLQSISSTGQPVPFGLSFDHDKLMTEFEFFLSHALLQNSRVQCPATVVSELRSQFSDIARKLVRPDEFVLNHRDFHSRNIMMLHGQPCLIDFQDARMGLPHYDAASLLRDSYLQLPEHLMENLIAYHFAKLCDLKLCRSGYSEFRHLFDIMAFQRNVKALGTFYYQSDVLGKSTFGKYIRPTLGYLPGYLERQPELKTAGTIILDMLEPTLS
ncbi:aminoglycoside phosphotransferase family protein [Prosthecochloris vibrioformis]|uniref:Aminoglycoside phosphotransferase n=1 Tax=Prosthecochloris vibrioformis TaxID=1098 RepID=A0A5C4RZ98_PROVB|nr:phosphotransferase [Prosthecochloris vibrioformis]TNJ36312.1 aminoglycoside phosphotransferase [Prosthecochloris vibrioformis]